jgi:hypothetical protein
VEGRAAELRTRTEVEVEVEGGGDGGRAVKNVAGSAPVTAVTEVVEAEVPTKRVTRAL